jgi:hypothetical protein
MGFEYFEGLQKLIKLSGISSLNNQKRKAPLNNEYLKLCFIVDMSS